MSLNLWTWNFPGLAQIVEPHIFDIFWCSAQKCAPSKPNFLGVWPRLQIGLEILSSGSIRYNTIDLLGEILQRCQAFTDCLLSVAWSNSVLKFMQVIEIFLCTCRVWLHLNLSSYILRKCQTLLLEIPFQKKVPKPCIQIPFGIIEKLNNLHSELWATSSKSLGTWSSWTLW